MSSNILTLHIEDGITTVAISPDCQLIAAGSLDKCIYVWNMQGHLLARLEGPCGHKDSVYSVAFSPNGKQLVSGSLDKTVKIWELNSSGHDRLINQVLERGPCLKTFEGHKVSFIILEWYSSDWLKRSVGFCSQRRYGPQCSLGAVRFQR